jgi:hypothetical protein
LNPWRVYELVLQYRAIEAPNCHIGEKGFKFEDDVIPALMAAFRVERDHRPEHPEGWVAICPHVGGKIVRVDFDQKILHDGELLLVVTMMEVSR